MRLLLTLAMAPAIACPAAAAEQDAAPCGDQVSTMGIVDCLAARTKVWDQRLNKAYQTLLQHIQPPQRDPLKAAQRLWVQYRDANCGFYAAHDGTIREVEAADCLRSMTTQRALELEEAIKSQ